MPAARLSAASADSDTGAVSAGGIAQPLLGVLGLLFVVLAVTLLGFLPGKVQALTTTITAITFGLPFLIITTLWWNGWPFQRLSRTAAGWLRFALLIVITLVLTIVGQAVTGRVDISGIFGASGAYGIFPYGFVLAASIFVPTLQLTFVTGKMPFHRFGPVASGLAIAVTVWALGVLQYFLLLNWDIAEGRPDAPPAAGNGPVYALDWPPVLLSMVILQLVFFVLLKGYPFSRISGDWTRFVVVNLFTIGGGVLLHWLLRLAGMSDDQISGAAGAIAGGVILIEILFDGWPFTRLELAGDRIGRIPLLAVVAGALYFGLIAVGSVGYPKVPGTPAVELWVAGVCLNLVAAFSIVHVAVFGRWPYRLRPAPGAGDMTSSERGTSGA